MIMSGLSSYVFFILFIISQHDADHPPPQGIGHVLEMNGGIDAQACAREGDHLHHHRAEEKVLQEGNSA
jgi:hypothetical protein